MVFFSSCNSVKFHSELLRYIKIECYDIHGKQKQQKRTSTFFDFCDAKKGILLCTDVAARGLDIPAVVCCFTSYQSSLWSILGWNLYIKSVESEPAALFFLFLGFRAWGWGNWNKSFIEERENVVGAQCLLLQLSCHAINCTSLFLLFFVFYLIWKEVVDTFLLEVTSFYCTTYEAWNSVTCFLITCYVSLSRTGLCSLIPLMNPR